MRIGLISDTHSLLRPQARDALADCHHILHAGDVGDDAILDALHAIAPLTAVRGNNDRSGQAARLPARAVVELGGVRFCVLHDLADVDAGISAACIDVVVSGHSHRPRIDERGGVLYVNPGSAGPRRFRLPVSVAQLTIAGGKVGASIIVLDVG